MRNIFNTRFQVFTSFFFFCYVIILLRLFSFIGFSPSFSKGNTQGFSSQLNPSNSRRVICDSSKIPLAFDQATYDIWIYPKLAHQNFLEISQKLAPVLDCQSLAIYDFLSFQKDYTPLVLNLHPNKAQRIKAYNLPGVDILARTYRVYPYKELVSSCIGYVNSANKGLSGIEQSCNDMLQNSNQNFSLPFHHSALSNLLWLQTSIDIRLQRQFSSILTQGLQELHVTRGMGVILDCYTGAIKALSVFPQFNPYNYSETPIGILNPWPILELYEPGSTFKPINLALAFESDVINSQTLIVDEGCLNTSTVSFFNATSFQDQFIRSQPTILTLETLVARSSNIGLIHIMNRLSPLVYYKWLKYLNLNSIRPFSMNLPYENYTNFPLQSEFEKTPETALFFALGHGFSLTPFQLLQLYMVFFNQGQLKYPFFIQQFVLSPTLFQNFRSSSPNASSTSALFLNSWSKFEQRLDHARDQIQIFSTRTCSFILGFLEEVLEYGTAQRGQIEGQRLAGKTGTSVYTIQRNEKSQRLTSFVVAYPLPSPQYLCFLLLHLDTDSPQQSATTAVPLVKAILDIFIQILRSHQKAKIK